VKQAIPQSGKGLPHSNTLARSRSARGIPSNSIVTLTTDFGSKDWFVGVMKAVILGINPQAALVDITHEVAAGDIRAGAFALTASCVFFPKGTVHVAVIDPGVGSQRRAIAVETADYCFVGPDNGVLSWALAKTKVKAIHVLQNEQYFLRDISRTFHGRDIFAPVAAHLSCGTPISKLGPRVKDLNRIPWPQSSRTRSRADGEVVYLDQFGNAITNIAGESIADWLNRQPLVYLRGKRVCRVGSYYWSVSKGVPIAVVGSTGFLEIAINGGNAARQYGIRIGDSVTVQDRRLDHWMMDESLDEVSPQPD
jgi:S-adenosylmethionine hydrolase